MLAAGCLAGVIFAIYAAGACSTIYVGDSGELVTAVYVLGIPHPPGYPLYVLLGRLWISLVPAGTVAWRMSLFSAACASAACGLLYLLGRRLGLRPVAALFSALLLAFGPSFWGEANVQRVYALGALFVVAATTASTRWYRERHPRALVLALFLCGLGATGQLFMAVYAIVLAVFVLVVDPTIVRRPRHVLAAATAFALGLVPYAYLPLRARAHPALNWGDPENAERFFRVVSRGAFWVRAWVERPSDLLPVVWDYLQSFPAELTLVGTALVAIGIVAGRRRGWPVPLFLLLMAANLAALAAHGSRSDIFVWHRYYIPSYVLAALFAGLGAEVVTLRLPAALRVLPLVVPALLLASGWQQFARSRYRIAEDFATRVLGALPPGAHLIATDDNILFVLLYLQRVEGRRPDVDLILQGIGGAPLPELRFDPDREPLFFTHHPNWRQPGLDVVPVGEVFRAVRAGIEPKLDLGNPTLDGEDDRGVPKDYLTRNLIGHFHYMRGVTFLRHDWVAARRELGKAGEAAPDNDVLWYNLGLVYRRNGLLADAVDAFERCRAINPRHLPSGARPRASDRLTELAAERERIEPIERTLAADASLTAIPPDSAAYHARLAGLLEARGEPVAARGHRLLAIEREPSHERNANPG